MRFAITFVLAAFAVGCLQVQRLPDGSANYGGITSAAGAARLNTSGVVTTAVREAARNGQPMSAMFDGNGGGSVQVGYAYGFYPSAYGYGYDPQFAASAMRSQQVWAAQLAAEQPVPVAGFIEGRLGTLETKVGEQDEAIQTIYRGAARARKTTR